MFTHEQIEQLKKVFPTKEEMEAAFADHRNVMLDGFDAILKKLDDLTVEKAASGHQLNRHEGWINELAKHTEYELSP